MDRVRTEPRPGQQAYCPICQSGGRTVRLEFRSGQWWHHPDDARQRSRRCRAHTFIELPERSWEAPHA